MASRLRPWDRWPLISAALLGTLLGLSACGESESGNAPKQAPKQNTKDPWAKTQDGPNSQGSQAGDPQDPIDPEKALPGALRACFGDQPGQVLQATLEFKKVRGDMALRMGVHLPTRMRLNLQSGGYAVLADEREFRVQSGSDGRRAEDLDEKQSQDLRLLRTQVGAAMLAPLHDARDARRLEGQEGFAFDADGVEWTMTVTPDGLPKTLATKAMGEIEFVEFTPRGELNIPRVVRLGKRGLWSLVIKASPVKFESDYFARPIEGPKTTDPETADPKVTDPKTADPKTTSGSGRSTGTESKPRVPVRLDLEATEWLVTKDPGTWPDRRKAFRAVVQPILGAKRTLAGFTWFFTENGVAYMAVPHRPVGSSATAVIPPTDWENQARPAERCLYLYPRPGKLSEVLQRARATMEAHAKENGLDLVGSPRAAPYVRISDPKGDFSEEATAKKAVRVEWTVR